jgi:hypothetical protein
MELSDQEIQDLKSKYGKIKTVIIPYDEDDSSKIITFYCKSPDKATRKMISDLISKGNTERAIIAGYNALRVAGDEVSVLQANDDAFEIADRALVKLLEVQQAIIKKN